MNHWEYRIASIAAVHLSSNAPDPAAAANHLDAHGDQGWEAVGMSTLDNGECAILMKRPITGVRSSGGRV